MVKQPSLAQIFEYHPGAINLVGFPKTKILDDLEAALGKESLLQDFVVRKRIRWGFTTKAIDPSFNPKYIEERQDLLKRINKSRMIRKAFFREGLPKKKEFRVFSYKEFLTLCDSLYETIERARTELSDFRDLPEARRIISRAKGFDSRLETMLKTLKSIEKAHIFAIDTHEGVIAYIPSMPSSRKTRYHKKDLEKSDEEWGKDILSRIRVKMKRTAIGLAKEAGLDSRERILDYAEKEFEFDPERENFRRDFEELALPIRLRANYGRFLKQCNEYNENLARNLSELDPQEWRESCYGSEDFEGIIKEELGEDYAVMPGFVYPRFGRGYNIQGLFPPKFMNRGTIDEGYVPLDFKANASERKFLLAGLHSGGKSFFLENIVLTSILGQLGLNLPAKSLALPRYNRIYYYKSGENGHEGGRLETELREINSIIGNAGSRDLVVIDEFLDSTSAEIANSLGSAILTKLAESKPTVFVTSHRNTNYEQLEREGWVLMSPGYRVGENGEVRPNLKIERGAPDQKINQKYILDKYGGTFGVKKK